MKMVWLLDIMIIYCKEMCLHVFVRFGGNLFCWLHRFSERPVRDRISFSQRWRLDCRLRESRLLGKHSQSSSAIRE